MANNPPCPAYRLFKFTLVAAACLGGTAIQASSSVSFDANSPTDVRRLCNAVSEGLRDPSSGRPLHEMLFYSGAAVTGTDTPEQKKTKLQRYWLVNRKKLVCVQMGFSATGGNIVKLAIEKNDVDALADFIRRWNLDMNFVDLADPRTPLDFTEDKLRLEGDSNLAVPWRRYRELLLRFGAKRKSDL